MEASKENDRRKGKRRKGSAVCMKKKERKDANDKTTEKEKPKNSSGRRPFEKRAPNDAT